MAVPVCYIQAIFTDGKVPIAFRHATLVLIPKEGEGQYRGVALLEAVQKLVSALINERRTNPGGRDLP
jgi:hypothetical protein